MEQLTQERLAELRDNASDLGVRGKGLDALKDLQDEPLADLGDSLVLVALPNALQVADG